MVPLAAVTMCLLASEPGWLARSVYQQLARPRDAIRSLQLRVSYSVQTDRGPAGKRAKSARYDVWLSGTRVRTDYTLVGSETARDEVGSRTVVCAGCDKPGQVTVTTVGTSYVTPVQYFSLAGQKKFPNSQHLIDWKRVGLLNEDLLAYSTTPPGDTFESFGKAGRLVLEAVDTPAGRVNRLRAEYKSGGIGSCDLSPAAGGNPVAFRLTAPNRPGQGAPGYERHTDMMYTRDPASGHWYPSRVSHSVLQDGQPVAQSVAEVAVVGINHAIPDRVFTLAEFGLRDGTPVEDPSVRRREDQPTFWAGAVDHSRPRGESGQRAFEAMQRDASPAPAAARVPTVAYYLAGAALLAAAGGLVYRSRR